MVKERVAIFVATYNQADTFLPKCLEYIKNQTYKNFICVVGDDHSKDKTYKVVEDLNDRRFVYHYNEKKYGQGLGFYNWAVRKYTNRYFCICDGDNYLYPESVEKRLREISKGYSAVYGYGVNVDYSNMDNPVIMYTRERKWDINDYIYGSSYNNYIDGSDIMFRRSSFIKAGGFYEGKEYQDYSVMVRIAITSNNNISYVPQVLAQHNNHSKCVSYSSANTHKAHINIF